MSDFVPTGVALDRLIDLVVDAATRAPE